MRKKTDVKIVKPTRKFVVSILLAAFLCVILWLIMMFINLTESQEFENLISHLLDQSGVEGSTAQDTRYDGIVTAGDDIAYNIEEAAQEYYDQCVAKANLSARASFEAVSELGDKCIGKVGDGGIIKIENGEATLGEGMRSGIRNYASLINDTKGLIYYDTPTMDGVRRDILVYSHIKGPYYYVEITNGREFLEYLDKYVNYDDVLQGIEAAYNVEIYLVCPDRENSQYFYNLPGDLVYYPGKVSYGELFDTANIADYDLPSTKQELLDFDGSIFTDDENVVYSYVTREVVSLDCVIVIVAPGWDAFPQAVEQTIIGIFIIMILIISFSVWLTSVYREMTQGVMTETKKETYSLVRVRLIALCYGILGAIVVFAGSVFFRTLNNIYTETTALQNSLGVMNFEILSNQDYVEQREAARRTLYLEYAKRVSELIEKNPEVNNKEDLQALNNIVGSEYIILYDSSGKEIGTSSDYINMELGPEGSDLSSADFRRILKGVPGIAHSAYKDEVTGRTLEQYGVRLTDPETGEYGVLILAVKPRKMALEDEYGVGSISRILRSLTPINKISFIIDPDTGFMTYCWSKEFYHQYFTADSVGLSKNMLRDGVTDFIRIGADKYFCVSQKTENKGILYMCTPNDLLLSKGFRYGFFCALGFAIVFAFVCLYLLSGYTNEMIEKVEKVEESGEGAEKDQTKDIKVRTKIGSMIRHFLGNTKPERKALLAFEIMLGLAFIDLFTGARTGNAVQGEQVLSYVLAGKWNKGFNIFALTSIILLFCTLLLGILFVRFVFDTLGRMLNSRGHTICKLISNMIIYIGILVFIYYALSYLGVDTNAILASVGVIGIGVSMGARDLIADIFAGVSMIFEGEYQVGDIVNIDGYRGMVQSVGVRSTRLIGRGGNIKVIGNKDIKSVTNLTKMNSWVAVTIKVDVNYPIRDAEEIVNQALPKIAEKCPQIISGPYYKGILSVEMGFAVLSIIAECNEDDYHKVERTLVREVLLALREKNVPVR